MTTEMAFLHDCIILDANCAIDLYASGRMGDILESIPGIVVIADYVFEKEVQWIYDGVEREKKPIELQPFIDNKLFTIVSFESEIEEISFIDFASAIGDDGEAITGAIALHRNWAIGTDDRKAQSIFSVEMPHNQLITTPEFMKYWVDSTQPPLSEIRTTLKNIRTKAKYEPSTTHPLYKWWHEFN